MFRQIYSIRYFNYLVLHTKYLKKQIYSSWFDVCNEMEYHASEKVQCAIMYPQVYHTKIRLLVQVV